MGELARNFVVEGNILKIKTGRMFHFLVFSKVPNTKLASISWYGPTNGIFLRGTFNRFFQNCYILTYTCPNGLGVGAIDRSNPAEDVFDPYWTLEVFRNFFMGKI